MQVSYVYLSLLKLNYEIITDLKNNVHFNKK
jgi:hypothetical protein